MSKDKKVTFNYMRYGTDKKMHITKNKDGTPNIRIVSPYEIVITNGRYYLIGAPEQGDTIFHYRLDQICNVEVLKSQKRKPVKDFPKHKNGFKLDEYMKERPYMMTGCYSLKVTLRLKKDAIGHVIDWLGKDVSFIDETEDTLKAIVSVNDKAMLYWALQYGMLVEVLEPQSLREEIRDVLADMSVRYAISSQDTRTEVES
jgi:predicted DNA-binding transcriptional regulator YafY